MVFIYYVHFEEYVDLSLRLISDTKLKHIEPMRRTKRSESQKNKLELHAQTIETKKKKASVL